MILSDSDLLRGLENAVSLRTNLTQNKPKTNSVCCFPPMLSIEMDFGSWVLKWILQGNKETEMESRLK